MRNYFGAPTVGIDLSSKAILRIHRGQSFYSDEASAPS